eukprot:2512311-Prymnesium_polylepis.1
MERRPVRSDAFVGQPLTRRHEYSFRRISRPCTLCRSSYCVLRARVPLQVHPYLYSCTAYNPYLESGALPVENEKSPRGAECVAHNRCRLRVTWQRHA